MEGRDVVSGRLPPEEALGDRLRQLRLQARKRPIDVFEAGLLPVDELLRYEAGLVRANVCIVHDMCEYYGTDLATTDHLVGLALWMNTLGKLTELTINSPASPEAWFEN
ncbi:helix-turn-helix transcriptional regulator [Actinoplanes sp. NPDC049596]|uniref:helix-turn-helix domain-containing protein n=1 Tax=unclassified Actinoplanes TaxID=2626549 RepID=UPI003430BD90